MDSLAERVAAAGSEGPFLESLNTMVWKNRNVFCAGLCLRPPATFKALNSELVANAKPFRVRSGNYTYE